MNVNSVKPQTTFRYSNPLKTLWKQGKLPTVKRGFYGDVLTPKTASLEHLKPHSKGGKTCLSNLVLATKKNNQKRSNLPIAQFVNIDNVKAYFEQFIGINTHGFNGNQYIKMITKTLNDMGVKIC